MKRLLIPAMLLGLTIAMPGNTQAPVAVPSSQLQPATVPLVPNSCLFVSEFASGRYRSRNLCKNWAVAFGAVPRIRDNAGLRAISTITTPEVLRVRYTGPGDGSSPELFVAQSGSCAGNGYADDTGLCNDTVGGNSWVATQLNGHLEIRNFGCIGDGTTPDTGCVTGFINAVKKIAGNGHVSPGTYKVTAQLPEIDQKIRLYGDGKVSATILGAYNRTGHTGVLALTSGAAGSVIENFSIQTAIGSSGGSVISVIATSDLSTSSEGIKFSHLWVTTTGNNTHENTVYLDGSAHTGGAIGLRETRFDDVDIFGANGYSLVAKSVVGLGYYGGSINGAGGTNPLSGSVSIDGTVSVPSSYVALYPQSLNGGISLAHTDSGVLITPTLGAMSGVSVANDSTADGWQIHARETGTVQTAWGPNSSFTGSDGTRHKSITNGDIFVSPGGMLDYVKRVTATDTPQTLMFDYTFTATPRCWTQVIDLPGGARETADLANIAADRLDYSTSSATSRAVDIFCKGIAANGNVLPGYP